MVSGSKNQVQVELVMVANAHALEKRGVLKRLLTRDFRKVVPQRVAPNGVTKALGHAVTPLWMGAGNQIQPQ